MKVKKPVIAGAAICAALVIVGAAGFGAYAYSEEQKAIEISEFNQNVEVVAAGLADELASLSLDEGDMTHDAVLENVQSLEAYRDGLNKEELAYHDGTLNLYEELQSQAEEAIDRDIQWLKSDYDARLAAISLEGDDKTALAEASAAAEALSAEIIADSSVAPIWSDESERDGFVSKCTAKANDANAKITEIEEREAAEKAAKEEAERKTAEEEAARKAAEAAAAEGSGSSSKGSSNGGGSSSKSSSSSKGSSSSSSSGSSHSSSSGSGSASGSNDDPQYRELPEITEEDWYSIPEDEEI